MLSDSQALHAFNGKDGATPYGGLLVDGSGNLYGTTLSQGLYGCGTVFALGEHGLTVRYNFVGGSDACAPAGGLVADESGDFYGTTVGGGSYNFGTVFKLGPQGDETVLYSFGQNQNDGYYPDCTLLRSSTGELYGTATEGGSGSCNGGAGCGTVFKLSSAGEEEWYSFAGGADGAYPLAGLIRGPQGEFYGTSISGKGGVYGTVFKISGKGDLVTLFAFNLIDGNSPIGGLLMDAAGNIYGTTYMGGGAGWGTVFRLDSSGDMTVLHTFSGVPDGAGPSAGLVMDAQGNLYGTTTFGGGVLCPDGCGTVFKVDQQGNETVLHRFELTDGEEPEYGRLIIDKAGNLYGMTKAGGDLNCNPEGCGTIFKLTPQ